MLLKWCWRRLLRAPWTARRSNQSILKEISPEYSLEGLMLTLKLQYSNKLLRVKFLPLIISGLGKRGGAHFTAQNPLRAGQLNTLRVSSSTRWHTGHSLLSQRVPCALGRSEKAGLSLFLREVWETDKGTRVLNVPRCSPLSFSMWWSRSSACLLGVGG